MNTLSAYLRSLATSRAVLIAFAVQMALLAAMLWLLVPQYQRATGGFVPFDLQVPLTQEMIGIQRGAFSEETLSAYLRFAATDFLFPPAAAVTLILLWAWLVNRAGVAKLVRWYDDGLWLAALIPMALDLAENVLFTRIIAAPVPLPATVDLAVSVHRAKDFALSLTAAVTVALAVGAALGWFRRRRSAERAKRS
ncbi:MAG: hypothetical protein SFV21_20785 [Rhodospirillaceae bacterium]|nr:hypothetical protein [Rhodospirillaceae bacterium]